MGDRTAAFAITLRIASSCFQATSYRMIGGHHTNGFAGAEVNAAVAILDWVDEDEPVCDAGGIDDGLSRILPAGWCSLRSLLRNRYGPRKTITGGVSSGNIDTPADPIKETGVSVGFSLDQDQPVE